MQMLFSYSYSTRPWRDGECGGGGGGGKERELVSHGSCGVEVNTESLCHSDGQQ